jgi:hypothetical protein
MEKLLNFSCALPPSISIILAALDGKATKATNEEKEE